MPYETSDGKTLPLDRAFTLNDISYPANWLRVASADDKAAIGVEWVDAPELKFKDERFYHNSVSPEGEVTSTPKELDQLKADKVRHAKANARAMLDACDWQVIASVERGRDVPADWSAYRSEVIAECNRIEEAAEAADFEGIQAIEEQWPENPDEKKMRLAMEAELGESE